MTKLILSGVLFLCTISSVLATTTPIKINDIKWPPFFFPKIEGQHQGLGKELLSYCINNGAYNLDFLTLPVKRTHLYMKSGQLDVAIYSHKKARESFVIYGKEPIFISEYGFVSVASEQVTINHIDDLYHYKFGNLSGIAHTPDILKIIEEKRLLDEVAEGYDIDSMFGQMLTKPPRFQVMANSKETFKWRAKQLGISEKVTIHPITVAKKPYFLTVSLASNNIKNKQSFLNDIDNCLKTTKQSGQYQKFADKYGL